MLESSFCGDGNRTGSSNRQDRLASMAVCATMQSEAQEAEGVVNIDMIGSQN